MPEIILEVHEGGSPKLSLWLATEPDFPFALAPVAWGQPAPLESVGYRRSEGQERPPAPERARAQASAPGRLPLYQRLNDLVAECDYRGKQIACGCGGGLWHCAMGKGGPMRPFEVSRATCHRCVRGEV